MSDIRYPIGKFEAPASLTREDRQRLIDDIADLPARLRSAVAGLDQAQLDTPYREGGWTVRQVVHHLPDSHVNAYVRFRLALTEDTPTIRPYAEALWAELPDARTAQISLSLDLMDALHLRWTTFLRSLRDEDWKRRYFHPEMGATMDMNAVLAMYSWHGRHHVAHITRLREREGWS